MSEPIRDEQDRWRELHELLGLSEGGNQVPSPPSKPLPAAPHVEPPHVEPPREVYSAPAPEMEIDEASEPLPSDENELALAQAEGTAAADSPLDEDERGPRRGRKRGRRGRRSRGRPDDVPVQEALDDDDTEVEPAGAVPATIPGPREHDAPHDQGLEHHHDDVLDDAVAEVEPAEPAAEDDDEPIETFADWNVPSWQEIVGSLYRPTR